MYRRKIVLNRYQDWLSVDKLIQPMQTTFIQADSTSLPVLKLFSRCIYLQVEPNAILNSRDFLLNNWRLFKYIVTYDDVVLSRCPNSVKYISGSCWVQKKDYENIDISLKTLKISSLVGGKGLTTGHRLRHYLYIMQRDLSRFPLTIYRSNRLPHVEDILNNPFLPDDDKMHLFEEFQFSITIENSQQLNYFTEKLIDCLLTKTIPIYWGCPNISEYFDTSGWIIFTDINDLKQKLSLLNDSYYSKYIDVINKNYETAKLYTDFHENLNRAIRTISDW